MLKYVGRRRETRETGTAKTLKSSQQNLQFESGKDQIRETCQKNLSKKIFKREIMTYLPYSAVPFIQFVNIRENTRPVFL